MIKIVKYLSWTVLLALIAGVAACGLTRLGLQELDQHAREDLGGFYLQTERGLLAYTRQGPVDAPAIILVHGFSTPKFVWEQLTPFLLDAGYQVVTYDHFGRGFSDRPDGPYDSALYQSELSSLIAGLDLKTPLTLVGYSMGGANVVDYAASYPQHVEQLVLIAPAGYTRNAESVSIMIAPVIGEWLFTMFGRQLAYASIQEEVEAGRAPPDMLVKFETQAAYGGYTDALLSTLRDYPMANLAHRYRIVGATDIPVTAIWGTADNIVPYAGAKLMAEDIPQLQLITLEGSNHNITYGEATLVAGALLEALNPP
jgi:pimeloyl-ACP methyl ester carboxylesterase